MTTVRTRKVRAIAAIAAAGLVAVLAGCTATPPQAPEPEPTPPPSEAVLGVVGSFTSFNPESVGGDTPANRAVADYLRESFAYLDDQLQVVGNGGFGEVERVSADPLTVRYKLFDGRTWSDGTPVTLDDLLFGWAVSSGWFDDASYDESGAVVSGTRYFDAAAPTDGVRDTARPVIDRSEDTITLTYDEPFADWNREWLLDRPVRVVAERAGVSVADLMAAIRQTPEGDPAAPVEPNPVLLAAAQAWNTGFDVDPAAGFDASVAVSNGPYAVESSTADELVLVRNDSYVGNHDPAFDRLVVRFFADSAELRTALADGEVDVANLGDATAAEISRLTTAGVTVLTGARPQILSLVYVDETGTLAPEVQRALTLSLDRERMVEESVGAVNPNAEPLQSFLASPASGEMYTQLVRDNGAPPTGADLAAATELIGDSAPVVRIRYEPTDVLSADLFAEIAGMAERAGISVRPVGDTDAADAELVSADVSGTLYRVARERTADGAGGADAVAALAELRALSDPEEVVTAARDVDRALFASGYGVPLVERAGAVASSSAIEGVGYTAAITAAPRYFWTWAPTTK